MLTRDPPRFQFAPRSVSATLALAVALSALPLANAAAAGPATSDTKAEADALSERAVVRFNAEDFTGAIELFEEAYRLDAQPNYLFNIGRVYEEQGDLAHAVEYYQRFVGSKGVDIEARRNATERLEVLRQALDALEPEPATEPRPVQDPEPLPEPVVTEPIEPADSGMERKRAMRIAGFTVLGVGGGALIVGGVFGGLALGNSNGADDERFVDDALDRRSQAKSQARVADALFITGGVLAAAGLVLVLVTLKGSKRGSSAHRRAVPRTASVAMPWANARGAGFSLTGRF